jgi:hypothetical protein
MSIEQQAVLALLEEAVYHDADTIETGDAPDRERLATFFLDWRERVKAALGMPCLLCGPMCICEEDAGPPPASIRRTN